MDPRRARVVPVPLVDREGGEEERLRLLGPVAEERHLPEEREEPRADLRDRALDGLRGVRGAEPLAGARGRSPRIHGGALLGRLAQRLQARLATLGGYVELALGEAHLGLGEEDARALDPGRGPRGAGERGARAAEGGVRGVREPERGAHDAELAPAARAQLGAGARRVAGCRRESAALGPGRRRGRFGSCARTLGSLERGRGRAEERLLCRGEVAGALEPGRGLEEPLDGEAGLVPRQEDVRPGEREGRGAPIGVERREGPERARRRALEELDLAVRRGPLRGGHGVRIEALRERSAEALGALLLLAREDVVEDRPERVAARAPPREALGHEPGERRADRPVELEAGDARDERGVRLVPQGDERQKESAPPRLDGVHAPPERALERVEDRARADRLRDEARIPVGGARELADARRARHVAREARGDRGERVLVERFEPHVEREGFPGERAHVERVGARLVRGRFLLLDRERAGRREDDAGAGRLPLVRAGASSPAEPFARDREPARANGSAGEDAPARTRGRRPAPASSSRRPARSRSRRRNRPRTRRAPTSSE